MKNVRMRLAVLLSMIMVLPSIIAILPVTQTNVLAASTSVSMSWIYGKYNEPIEVEQGQEFYIGDCVTVSIYGKKSWFGTASMLSASYSSSRTSVAAVDANGYFIAKEPGSTKVTVTFRGKKCEYEIKVVEAGTFAEKEAALKLQEIAKKFPQKLPSKITTNTAYSLYKIAAEAKQCVNKYPNIISEDGYLLEKSASYSDYYQRTAQLAAPMAGRIKTFMYLLKNDFAYKNNPTSTRSAKVMKIKSASAKPNAITLKLKKKIDATQVIAARICYDGIDNEKIKGADTAYIQVWITDIKKRSIISGIAEIKKGSATVKIRSFQQFNSKKGKYVKTKLKKGQKYIIENGTKTWTNGKIVKVR